MPLSEAQSARLALMLDLAANVARFQKMPAPQVNAYLKILDRACGRAVYLRNNRHGPECTHADLRVPPRWVRAFERSAAYSDKVYEAAWTLPAQRQGGDG